MGRSKRLLEGTGIELPAKVDIKIGASWLRVYAWLGSSPEPYKVTATFTAHGPDREERLVVVPLGDVPAGGGRIDADFPVPSGVKNVVVAAMRPKPAPAPKTKKKTKKKKAGRPKKPDPVVAYFLVAEERQVG